MRSLLLLLLFFLCALVNAQELDLSVASIPAELLPNANTIVRQYDYTYQVQSEKAAIIKEHKIVTLLNNKHKGSNYLAVHYDADSKITTFKAKLYDAKGQFVREAQKSEIEDFRALEGGQFYTDSRVKVVNLVHTDYPYTVEFEYEKKLVGFQIVNTPLWVPQNFHQSVQSATFTALVPISNQLLFSSNQLAAPREQNDGKNLQVRWELQDASAKITEPDAPSFSQLLPYLQTGLRDVEIDGYKGRFDSWQSFGLFMSELMNKRDQLPKQLQSIVHEITDELEHDRDKINALYRLLQERTRYVGIQLGIGGWQPFSAEFVEEKRYGDCKALSNYLGAMLKEIGIESYPVLIHASDRPDFPVDERFVSPAFNHMILYIPSEDMYLECTDKLAPTAYLGSGRNDRNVLWLTPAGGKIQKTPAMKAADHGYTRTTEINLTADGAAQFHSSSHYYGTAQEYLRYFLDAEQNTSKQLELLHADGILPNVSPTLFTSHVKADHPVVQIDYATSLSNYARKMGSRIFLPINKYQAFDQIPDKTSDRQYPIEYRKARFYVDTIQIKLPDNMEIESLGEETTFFEYDTGSYRATTQVSGSNITWIRILQLLPATLPASEYEAYRQFFVAVAKADKRQVVLKEKRTK